MTPSTTGIIFGPYRLDPREPRLLRDNEPVRLQPRPLAVLCYLAARPGRVVSRDELIERLWPGIYVTRAVVKVAVRAIREALEDDADAPRYLETVGREGYRFIAEAAGDASPASRLPTPDPATVVVGRADDLAVLRSGFERVLDGARRVVLVTGEVGIGKSTRIDRFVEEVERSGSAWIARGQCLEQ